MSMQAMKKYRDFDKYDHDLLEKARRLIMKVYEYNYGDPKMKSKVKRLETIINKLEELLNERT